MALKLYPPNIEGTIPAFYGAVLTVPFSMNKAVAKKDVYGMQIKIKAIQSGAYILTADTINVEFDPACIAHFNFSEQSAKSRLKVGQHYKIQIAYIANDEEKTVGYFSTVGVVKYTYQPFVSIEGLETGIINMHQYDYVGKYINSGDTTEKLYSYCFNLYDSENVLIQSSGEKIHNSELDVDLAYQIDTYNIAQDLEINKSYYLEYTITTVNGLTDSSGKYRIMQKKSINPEIKADLVPELNFENGYINVRLIGQINNDGVEYAATGAFKILRASEEDDYQSWNEVLKFTLYGQQPSRWIWKDFTVKQGVSYRYALQQYNDSGLTSNRLESDQVYADFEHAFIYDGTYQLKIKYNPKVTGFKNNLLENKLNTIGSQHPFIFRNGNVKYKEFSISGLISCQSDDEFLFINEDDFGRYDYTSNLISENIASEREFKLKVLEWLNNGQPKLFRSPTEGNYIIRLLNVSLTPNDTVGRMLHTFNATACEIAEYSYQNLNELGLISVGDPTTKQLRWETVELSKTGLGSTTNIINYNAVSLRFEGLIPGDRLYINDGITRVINRDNNNASTETMVGFNVTIGATGSYIVDLEAGVTISTVHFIDSPTDNINVDAGRVQHQGTLTYAYYSKVQNRFDSISDIDILDAPLEQYIGEHDIINEIEDVKTEIQGFYWIHCMLRDIQEAYYNVVLQDGKAIGKYFTTSACTEELEFDPYVLYRIRNLTSQEDKDYWLDGNNLKTYEIGDYSTKVYFNSKEKDLSDTLEFTVKAPKNINELTIGNGIMAEVSYQKQVIDYAVETDKNYPDLIALKAAANSAYITLINNIYYSENETIPDDYEDRIRQYRNEYETAYNRFIVRLEEVLKEKEEAQGDVAQ